MTYSIPVQSASAPLSAPRSADLPPPGPWTHARGHIAMILGLLSGLALVLWLEGIALTPAAPADPMAPFAAAAPLPLAVPRLPDTTEMEAARIAWAYFRNNTSPQTGLVASVDGYPSTTLWETGGLIDAILSAERLGLIDAAEARQRLTKVLHSLARLPLTAVGMPNKAYDIRDLRMVNYQNKPTASGIGWSALDIGRLMAALTAAQRAHPELAGQVQNVLRGWKLRHLVAQGELNGANIKDGVIEEHQEGRIGYEQYAAKAMLAFTLDATAALDMTGQLVARDVDGIPVPGDSRLNKNQVPSMTTSEPYLLDGLEFGFDARSAVLGAQVYRAQEARFAATGKLTAVSEGHVKVAPFFAYATVWGGGQPWAVLTIDGQRLDSQRVLSTKAAFGWDALYDTAYTDRLVEAVQGLNKPDRGWFEGRYERDGKAVESITANTNAMVLVAVAFRKAGPLIRGEAP